MVLDSSIFDGYLRVSTEDQADHGVSLDAQEARVRAHAESLGIPIAKVFIDAGESAKTLIRPGITQVITRMSAGSGGVIVAKLDRLTRSLRDWTWLVEEYFARADGPRLLSASEAIETRTAAGRLVLNIMMAVGQHEREVIVERTGQAMDHKRSKGERLGTIPFGWKADTEGKVLVPSPIERGALRVMEELRNKGWTLQCIAEDLDKAGYPTRTGRPWSTSTISKLLREVGCG